LSTNDRIVQARNRFLPPVPARPGLSADAALPVQLDRFELPHSYGRDYGRAHLQLAGAHSDTSVSWHSLLQLMLLALLATGGTIGNIFIISGLTIIEHFQMPGTTYFRLHLKMCKQTGPNELLGQNRVSGCTNRKFISLLVDLLQEAFIW
jgi:hypothetical protein